MPEWRYDPVTRHPVIIAEGRLARPVDYPPPAPVSVEGSCPFCEGNEAMTPPEVVARRPAGGTANGRGWSVRVIPNKFPTFEGVPTTPAPEGPRGPGSGASPAWGAHEVVIQSPTHSPGLPYLGVDRAREVFQVYWERLRALEATEGIRTVALVENWGTDSGGSLQHPHGQLLATSEVVPALASLWAATRDRAAEWATDCPMEHVLRAERDERTRVVWEGPRTVAFAPYASVLPYQLRFLLSRHTSSISHASSSELAELSEVAVRAQRVLLDEFPGTSYNLVGVFPTPLAPSPPPFHGYIDLLPRLARADGFELGAHVPVNPVRPEKAAEMYRNGFSRGP